MSFPCKTRLLAALFRAPPTHLERPFHVHFHGNSKLPVFLDQTSPVIKRKKFLFVCTGYMAHSLKKCMVSTSGCWSKSLSSKGSRKAHIPLGSCCTESDTAQKVFCFCVVHTSMQSNLSLRCTKMHALYFFG